MDDQHIALAEGVLGFLFAVRDAERCRHLIAAQALSLHQHMSDHMHLHQIRGAGNAQRHARRQHDQLTIVNQVSGNSAVHRVLKQIVGVAFLADHQRHHTPAQRQLPPDRSGGRAADNHAAGTILRDHTRRGAGLGHSNNGAGPQIMGRGHGGVADGAGDVRLGAVFALAEAALIVNAGLGPQSDPRHGLHGFQRIHTRGGLAGEHNGAGAVVDSVGHVGGFRTSGAGVLHHGIQHLGRGNGRLARRVALLDEHLLQHGHLF